MPITDAERQQVRRKVRACFNQPILPLYDAAMRADDDYLEAIRAAGGVNRYKLTPQLEADPRVVAAFERKQRADNAWLAALRLMGF